ncbi:MAG TPA: DUF523 domain-containing protein [Bacillota bacterium]|nr:DUF523 domain-containing protein [Bacillota bacterium]HOA35975.1 DUF523 domain-containing protein [Bacillota bacterium]HOL16387.1 DUF523 domain-containing protein [Bacillota bacterium]HPZ10729.1 DUF523 domain-containing protein [Bacillota bacterium]HQE08895.1 DUF523 domain-containing protein [Bacillota bacterium]
MPEKVYLVSACLLGLATRYDGGENRCPSLLRLCRGCRLLPVCPEQLGGLPTPRRPAEIRGGDGCAVLRGEAAVMDDAGGDVTEQFLRGAAAVLQLARLFRVDGAILKSGSPSCGTGLIRDGSFSGRRRAGDGVAAALLKLNGIPVYSEKILPLRRRRSSPGKKRWPR